MSGAGFWKSTDIDNQHITIHSNGIVMSFKNTVFKSHGKCVIEPSTIQNLMFVTKILQRQALLEFVYRTTLSGASTYEAWQSKKICDVHLVLIFHRRLKAISQLSLPSKINLLYFFINLSESACCSHQELNEQATCLDSCKFKNKQTNKKTQIHVGIRCITDKLLPVFAVYTYGRHKVKIQQQWLKFFTSTFLHDLTDVSELKLQDHTHLSVHPH